MKYSLATVKAVRSGSCLVLLPTSKDEQLKDQPEKAFFFSWVSAPKLGEGDDFERDEQFAWGSREFMRKLCVEKDVEYCGEEYGVVYLEGQDVIQWAVSQGWAKVNQQTIPKKKKKEHDYYTKLLNSERTAKTRGRGLWNKAQGAAYESSRDPRPRDLRGQNFIGMVVQIVSGEQIIVVLDGTDEELQVFLSSIMCPKLGGDGVDPKAAYAYEAKEFVRAHLIGCQVRVQLEYSIRKVGIEDTKTYVYGSVFLGNPPDSQNVSELVIAEGLGNVSKENGIKVVSNYYDALCSAESDAILNKKGMYSGVDPPVIEDFSNATWPEVGNACNHIFFCPSGEYMNLYAVVDSVIPTKRRDKIILLIQRDEKKWKIAFSLFGVTWPRGNEPYANEAIQLLRQTIVQRRVEIELNNIKPIDYDGYFVGTLLFESSTHVAIPLLQAGLAKVEPPYPKDYYQKLIKVQDSAQMKRLKIWQNYV